FEPSEQLTTKRENLRQQRDETRQLMDQQKVRGKSSTPDFDDDLYITWTGSNSYFISPYLISKRRLWTYGEEYGYYVLKDGNNNFINERGEVLGENQPVVKYTHKIVMPVIGQTNHGDRSVGMGAINGFDEASYNYAGIMGTALVQWWN